MPSEKPKKPAQKPAQKQNEPGLLSGGNPQIPKGDGDAAVQSYIAAMPGWKHDVGKQLDALITDALPDVRKAIKWNSPFYGNPSQTGWFLSFHCMTKYIKLGFFQGASLDPLPPEASTQQDVRYFHIKENDQLDEAQFRAWVTQASQLPGWGKS